MKYFMLLLFVLNNNFNSKLQAQETENQQETIAKFIISDWTKNGKNLTSELIDENAYLVIYRNVENNEL